VDHAELDSIVASIENVIDAVSIGIASFYPKHPKYGQPVGYIRIRQLRCEGPACGRTVPATSKFELDESNHVGLLFDGVSDTLHLKVAKAPSSGFPNPTMNADALTCPVASCGFTTPRSAVIKQWDKYRLNPELVAVWTCPQK
jgi:hypothetical protein